MNPKRKNNTVDSSTHRQNSTGTLDDNNNNKETKDMDTKHNKK